MDNLFDGFLVQNNDYLLRKTNFILRSGRDKLHLVLDFDRTLTQGKDGSGQDITTWHVLQNYISKEARADYWRFYKKYRPLEAQNKITETEAITWWSSILNIYRDNQLKWSDVAVNLETEMPPRTGVKELFDVCAEKKIPTIIISAGIKNLIDLWCQKHGFSPSLVLSTDLFFDSQGVVNGWDKNSLIHALNKKEMGHEKLLEIRKRRPNTILVSDSIHDADMVEGGFNSLKIIIDDMRFDDFPRRDDFFEKIFKKFDLIIKTGTFAPVIEILKKI